MPRHNKSSPVSNVIYGTNSGIPFYNVNSFTVPDTRFYGPTVNPAPGAPNRPVRSRPTGLWKQVTYTPKPFVWITKRTLNKRGKWVTNKVPLKVTKMVLFYPKSPKRHKRKSLKGQHGLKPNAMSREVWKIGPISDGAEVKATSTAGPQFNRSCFGDLVLSAPPWNPYGTHFFNLANEMSMSNIELGTDAEALSALREKIHDQDVNLAQAFAERTQTIGMIADAAVRLGGALRSVRRGNLVAAAKSLFPQGSPSKQLANDWLVLQYGIKPLISDVQGMALHLAKLKYEPPRMKTVVTRRKRTHVTRETAPPLHSGRGIIYIDVQTEVTVKYSCELEVNVVGLRQASKLGLTNPAQLTWELIPFSFVIDWFLPIGDYLANLSSGEGIKITNFYKTIHKRRIITVTGQYGGAKIDSYTYTGTPFTQRFEKVEMSRTLVSSLPPVPLPTFKNPVSSLHIANSIALIRQLMK